MRSLRRAVAGLGLLASGASAQGSPSVQGFGYPTGQLSSRALATGGALGEFDPLSQRNPAALASWGRPALFFQYEPEYRRVEAGDRTGGARLTRFPLIAAAVPIRSRAWAGVSVATFLDRTWASRVSRRVLVREDSVTVTTVSRSDGAINDVRLGGAWAVRPTLHVGIGLHAYTGENRIFLGDEFEGVQEDTLVNAVIAYSGLAASLGAEWQVARHFGIAASARHGGTLRSSRNDTTLSRGEVPDRVGVAVRFDGIAGTRIGLGFDWEGWSSMESLRSAASSLRAFDATTISLGAETLGPRWFGQQIPLRVGARRRSLPFGVGDTRVNELAIGGGLGLPLAAGRAQLDLAVLRARRTADELRERSWTISAGFVVRP